MTANSGAAFLDNVSLEERADQARRVDKGQTLDPTPEELPTRIESLEYPLDALGPILGTAAERIAYHVQVTKGMAGQSVLAAASLAVQGHCDVKRGTIGTGPTSLYCITIAGSGDRKSATDRLALAPIRDYERELRETSRDEGIQYKTAVDALGIQRDSVIKANAPKGKEAMGSDARVMLQEQLAQVDANEPPPPARPNLTFEEPTAEGIYRHMREGKPTAGLFSGEGVGFFGGHGMSDENRGRTIAMVSKLWDGDPVTRTRGSMGESGILAGRRMSAHLMMQPIVAAKVLSDPLLQGQGFLARFLVCHEPSIAGTRFLKGRDLAHGPDTDPAIDKYWRTLDELIRRPLDIEEKTGELQPRVAKIEGEAFIAWCKIHDGVESQLTRDGQLSDIQAFASKAAENVARIAAVLATVEGFDHPQVEHVERAGRLAAYYLSSMSSRTQEAHQDQQAMVAGELLEWIKANGGEIRAADFKHLHRDYRSAKKARALLTLLVDMGHLEISASNHHGSPNAWRIREVSHA